MTTNDKVASVVTGHDKLVHFMAFLVESWLFVRMLACRRIEICLRRRIYDLDNGRTWEFTSIDKYVVAVVVCLFSAVGSEFLQSFLSHGRRTFDLMDMAYNVVGSIVGILIAFWQER